jgi:hypothetical protein
VRKLTAQNCDDKIFSFFRFEFGIDSDSLRDSVGEGGFFEFFAFGDLCTLLQFVMVDDVLKIIKLLVFFILNI